MSYKFNPFTGTLDEVGAGGTTAAAGSDTQVQYNDGGSFAGDSGLTYDATSGALSVGGKTVTTDAPVINLSQTWNNAATTFTGLKLNVTNTASAAGSSLLDLQVDGSSRLYVTTTGAFCVGSSGGPAVIGSINNPSTRIEIETSDHYYFFSNGSPNFGYSNGAGLAVNGNNFIGWGSTFAKPGHGGSVLDTRLHRDGAAGIVAQRNGANAQTFRLYNTLTGSDVSATGNYERGFLQWNSNVFEIGTEAGSGGGSEQPVRITAATLKLPNLPTYADNAAATTGGLVAGDVYKTATGELRITV